MDPMIDQVRTRTDDLHRVAADIRRERDLRAAATAVVARLSAVTPFSSRRPAHAEMAREADCLATSSGQAA